MRIINLPWSWVFWALVAASVVEVGGLVEVLDLGVVCLDLWVRGEDLVAIIARTT